jgi:hypothetical protein
MMMIVELKSRKREINLVKIKLKKKTKITSSLWMILIREMNLWLLNHGWELLKNQITLNNLKILKLNQMLQLN